MRSLDITSRKLEGKRLAGIVYIHNIADSRYTRAAKSCFDLFHSVCGVPANVIIVTTHWSNPGTPIFRQQESREQMFKEEPWRRWIDQGLQLHRTYDTEKDAHKAIDSLLRNQTRVQALQRRVGNAYPSAMIDNNWKAVKIVRQQLENESKGAEIFTRTELEAQLRILDAWASYVKPSMISKVSGLFGS